MTIELEYYLNCSECGELYPIKADNPEDVQEQAEEDGWVTDDGGDPKKDARDCRHYCPKHNSNLGGEV